MIWFFYHFSPSMKSQWIRLLIKYTFVIVILKSSPQQLHIACQQAPAAARSVLPHRVRRKEVRSFRFHLHAIGGKIALMIQN